MKSLKYMMLMGAAGLAVQSAQAADLPVKAKAIEYVKVCSLYGAGFYYIPGTDTCVKIGGHVRVATSINAGTYDLPGYQSGAASSELNTKNYFSRARLRWTHRFSTDTVLTVMPSVGTDTVVTPRPRARVIAVDWPRALNELVRLSDSSFT